MEENTEQQDSRFQNMLTLVLEFRGYYHTDKVKCHENAIDRGRYQDFRQRLVY